MVQFVITLNMVYKTINIVFLSLVKIKQTLNNLYEYIVSGLYNICQDFDRFVAKNVKHHKKQYVICCDKSDEP